MGSEKNGYSKKNVEKEMEMEGVMRRERGETGNKL